MTAPGIAVYCEAEAVTQDEAALMTRACAVQAIEFCSAWGRMPIEVRFYRFKEDIPAGTPTIAILAKGDDPEALAYHTDGAHGSITGLVDVAACLAAGGGMLAGEPSISSALSHEILETICDPFVGGWEDMPDGVHEVAREVCDPVQDVTYEIVVDGEPVSVSNWVLPEWFSRWPSDGAKFDRQGVLRGPGTRTEGGYMVKRRGGRTVQDGMMPPHKPAAPLRRNARRVGKAANALDEQTANVLVARAHAMGPSHATVVLDVYRSELDAQKREARRTKRAA